MATRHPVTGVLLNLREISRKSLSEREALTAKLLRADGHKIQDIAGMLGTNQGRVAEALQLGRNAPPGQGTLI
ncbi:hypothetical protein [Frigidibacter sp. MR17.24]|uniref:hypothetical protein n=1 Tax=Frigidibacter sp. MR17.24 TaxID=3127345 RepID=UPI0030130FE1